MAETIRIRTGRPEFDELPSRVQAFLSRDFLDVVIDGEPIRGYRPPDAKSIWIRDHSDMMRGFRHFETDLTSAVTHFAETQAANGRIFDYFTTFPEKPPSERENWTKYVRVPVEADVEFRFVKAVWLAWQATGDDEWVRGLLPAMERALEYVRTSPQRWHPGFRLVKRAYTIDTWDFAYTAGRHDWLQFQIDDRTFWGIFHGDNTGYYEAYRLLARLLTRLHETDRAARWDERALEIRESLNRVCWNGRFYRHFVPLHPVSIPGVDEEEQLSLSNPMAINRGAATPEMATGILEEYRRRGAASDAFAEWFSIDPPFPDGVFGDEKLVRGAYVNGGIMPLVGGELARAAFEHGMEEYAADILARYHALVAERGETYLWYFPDGTAASVETSTSPEAEPTDGWGSSAMLWALVEGLAGVVDHDRLYRDVTLSPRWPAAGVTEAEVRVGYPASGAAFGYSFALEGDAVRLRIEAPGTVRCHVLLPPDATASRVTVDGAEVPFEVTAVASSRYADFPAEGADVEIGLDRDD